MNNAIYKCIGTVFGIGYLPLAPGTWASALAGFVWYGLQSSPAFTLPLQLVLCLVCLFSGVLVSVRLIPLYGKDPSCVVIDEVAGMWLTCLFLPHSVMLIAIAFVVFRILDISKPFGIRKAEKFRGGWGIMMDDVFAGIAGNVIIQAVLIFWK